MRIPRVIHPQDVNAMINHSIPTAGPFAAVSLLLLLSSPVAFLTGVQIATIGQDRLVALLDMLVEKAKFVTDAVNDDGSLRKDAPLTVLLTKLPEDGSADSTTSQRGAKDENEKASSPTNNGPSSPSSPSSKETFVGAFKNTSSDNRRKAAAVSSQATIMLERASEMLHKYSDDKRGPFRRLLASAVLKMWLKVAKIMAGHAVFRASKVFCAYVVCFLVDYLRQRTFIGSIGLFRNKIGFDYAVAPSSSSSTSNGGQAVDLRPYFLTSSFRYVCLAFLSESTAVMNVFGHVCHRRDSNSDSNANMNPSSFNRLLSKFAFFYDDTQLSSSISSSTSSSSPPPLLSFKSSLRALVTLLTFQHLPLVFGHRHLTGIGPIEETVRKSALIHLDATDLTYWVFLKDLMRHSHEMLCFFSNSEEGSEKAREEGENEASCAESDSDTKKSGVFSRSLRNLCSVSGWHRYLTSVAKANGYRDALELKVIKAEFEDEMAKAEESAKDIAMAAFGIPSSSPHHTVGQPFDNDEDENEDDNGDSRVTEIVDTNESEAGGNTNPNAAADNSTAAPQLSDPLVQRVIAELTREKKAELQSAYDSQAALRPQTVFMGLVRCLLYYGAKYGFSYAVLSFADCVLKGTIDLKTGKVDKRTLSSIWRASSTAATTATSAVGSSGDVLNVAALSQSASSSFGATPMKRAAQHATALVHNALCATVFDGKKGIPYLWHASVVPIAWMVLPKLVKTLVLWLVKARLGAQKKAGTDEDKRA